MMKQLPACESSDYQIDAAHRKSLAMIVLKRQMFVLFESQHTKAE
jgi:hypothetical protein